MDFPPQSSSHARVSTFHGSHWAGITRRELERDNLSYKDVATGRVHRVEQAVETGCGAEGGAEILHEHPGVD